MSSMLNTETVLLSEFILPESTLAYYTNPKVRTRLVNESGPKWGYNKADKPADIPNQSFRKLTVD